MAKIYVVVEQGEDDQWIDSAFVTRRLAEGYIERGIRRTHAQVLISHEERRAKAEAWVAAGGGLSRPLDPAPTLEEFRAHWHWRIEEVSLFKSLP